MKELYEYITNYLNEQSVKYSNNPIIKDKLEHIKNTVNFSKMVKDSSPMLELAMLFHDIGRFPQFELLGNFNDYKVSHMALGEEHIINELRAKRLKPSKELDAIRLVIQYHGRQQFIPNKENINEEVLKLLDNVSNIDAIENGCIGAIGYLEREVMEDAKGYKQKYPNLDMKSVSNEVLTEFLKGNKFDKMICKTYAEYILFAAVLAIQGLKGENCDLAKKAMALPCYGYENAIEGYKSIFERYIDENISKTCFDSLCKFYSNVNQDEKSYQKRLKI